MGQGTLITYHPSLAANILLGLGFNLQLLAG
jgi:hypothetical protein